MVDLDDFFAKKDRKKSKGRKFATTEEVAKKLEDTSTTSRKSEKPGKKERGLQDGDDSGAPAVEQDEWRDFEEEKKDYTGLKIGNLTIGSSESGGGAGSEANAEQNAPGDETEGEFDRKTGPWKQRSEPPEKKPEPPVPVAAPVQNLRNADSKGTYVSPGKLNQTNHLQPLRSSHRAKATAPDVHNEELFPSLSSSKADQRRSRNEGAFEVVSHNRPGSHQNKMASVAATTAGQGPKLSLGNRYNTLSNDS